ncbi:MAG TPA: IS110 family transposase [Candidatus Anammoximicrobium sp.]|nr:IS110 family transposase [Verrucomicrobiota bacterium]HPM85210.1 IS110 family transposase [Candidatus Anammoximicrobium sp.]
MQTSITYVAMDTHKKQHQVAWGHPETGAIQQFSVPNTPREIERMVKRLRKQTPGEIHVCYEAGICGFVLQRQLQRLGCVAKVIAPSLVLRKPGERIKTDRRDARKLLSQFAAGQLTAVVAPSVAQEADRELTRCRESAQMDLKRARQRLNSLLVRHGYIYTDGNLWTGKHQQWLRGLSFDQPQLRTVFEEYSSEVEHCFQRVQSLDQQVQQLAQSEPYRAAVAALRCFRGIDTLTAITLLTEIFEFGRFDSPRALMAYLGVTPSEDSSGERRRPGAITKTGNRRVRRILTETGWHYRHPPHVSKALQARRQGQPAWAVDLADRAAKRLSRRYRHLIERGKAAPVAVMAVVRELIGFLWALLRQLPGSNPAA